MNTIAFFLSNYSIGNSPSVVNLVDFLSDRFEVTVFCQQMALTDVSALRKPSVRTIQVPGRLAPRWWLAHGRAVFQRFDRYIAFDPHGFCLCKSLFPGSRPFYYSLELYLKNDHFGLNYGTEIMAQERRRIREIRGLIIQSHEKEELFRTDYGLPGGIPCLILPVTGRGPSSSEKSQWLRKDCGVRPDRRIALHLGGIAEWFSCIELAEVFGRLDAWVLVFQGYPDPRYEAKLRETVRRQNLENVVIRDKRYKDLREVDEIVKSCDLGVAWYNDVSAGFRSCGFSSGKIAAYLRFGLPVVAKRYPSTIQAIERPGCGVCVDTPAEIPAAIARIEKDFEAYSLAARQEYESVYRFDRYEKEILHFLDLEGA